MENNNDIPKEDIEEPIEVVQQEKSLHDIKEIIQMISTFVDKDTIKDLSTKYLAHLNKKSEEVVKVREMNFKVGEKNSSYFQIQYWQDILMVFLVLLSIGLLSYFKLLESSTTGTLMGSVIGYALGQFRERYRPKNI